MEISHAVLLVSIALLLCLVPDPFDCCDRDGQASEREELEYHFAAMEGTVGKRTPTVHTFGNWRFKNLFELESRSCGAVELFRIGLMLNWERGDVISCISFSGLALCRIRANASRHREPPTLKVFS
jgi:hypothetical protein